MPTDPLALRARQVSATTYTHGHEPAVVAAHGTRTVSNSAPRLGPRLRGGMAVLDVGCGPGSITADLAGLVSPGGTVVGLDRALSVVKTASANHPGFAVVSGDVASLPFADGSFDVVHAHQVLQHLADPVAALREMARVCRQGGIIAARDADYAAMTWFPEHPALTRWRELYRAMARANGAEPDAGRRLASWANAAGLRGVDVTAAVWCYSTPEQRAWWAGQWAERVLTGAFVAQAAAHGVGQAELAALAGGYRQWAVEPDGWFVVVHGDLLATPAARP